MSKLLIAASGTGGHIFPALAVANQLPVNWEVFWVGAINRLEIKLVPKNFGLEILKVGGIQGSFAEKFLAFSRLILSIGAVRNLLIKQNIEIVFTTGGYIAAPVILAAVSLGLPVVIHESNSIPGRVTRLFGRFCHLVALGLPVQENVLKGCKTIFTGTPIRKNFFIKQSLPDWVPTGDGPLLIVIGGSQGAVGLNIMLREILPKLLTHGCRVVHITGENDSNKRQIEHTNFVEKIFTSEISALLQNADLVVSRAGAGILSELTATGTPAILVPFPQAKDNHQEANANSLAQYGAAVIVHQHEPGHKELEETIFRLLKYRLSKIDLDDDPLSFMSKKMHSLSVRDADIKIAQILESFI